jgi:hypothetical protein
LTNAAIPVISEILSPLKFNIVITSASAGLIMPSPLVSISGCTSALRKLLSEILIEGSCFLHWQHKTKTRIYNNTLNVGFMSIS